MKWWAWLLLGAGAWWAWKGARAPSVPAVAPGAPVVTPGAVNGPSVGGGGALAAVGKLVAGGWVEPVPEYRGGEVLQPRILRDGEGYVPAELANPTVSIDDPGLGVALPPTKPQGTWTALSHLWGNWKGGSGISFTPAGRDPAPAGMRWDNGWGAWTLVPENARSFM